MKATGKRTAETRSTYNGKMNDDEQDPSVKSDSYQVFIRFSLTNCALSRTGLAAFAIGAGCDTITCAVCEGEFAFDNEV